MQWLARVFFGIGFSTGLLVGQAAVLAADSEPPTVGNYILVDYSRIGRTIYELTYQADLTNPGGEPSAVSCQMSARRFR